MIYLLFTIVGIILLAYGAKTNKGIPLMLGFIDLSSVIMIICTKTMFG